jgi:hypothetical protein
MYIVPRVEPDDEGQAAILIGITIMFSSFCSLTVMLRLFVKRMRKSRLELDDYLCFVAYVRNNRCFMSDATS